MKRSRILSLLLSGALLAGVLGGCGTSDPQAGTGSSGAASTPDENVTATLTYWDTSDYADLESNLILATAIEKFNEKYPNVTIDVVSKGRVEDLYSALSIAFSAGNGPDLFWSNVGEVMSDYVKNGYLMDLSDLSDSLGWEDVFYSSALANQMTLWDGIYAVPKAQKVLGIYYNKSIYQQFGFEVPATEEEFIDQCETLLAAGITPIGNAGKYAACTNRWFDAYLDVNGGTELHDQLLSGEAAINCDAVVQSFEDMAGMVKYFQNGYLAQEESETTMALVSGDICFTFDGSWVYYDIQNAGGNVEDYGFFVFTGASEPRADTYGDGVFASADTEHPELVKYFLECYSSAECYQASFESTGAITVARYDVIDQAGLDSLNQDILAALNAPGGAYMPSNEMAWPSRLSDLLLEYIDQVALGEVTPADAAASLDETAASIGFYK
ncbi:ABC transporter substrate-binding protein [Candidatus Allofournierella excrementavium]|uniref:ABC transporter substrate-binding protein n=1 Tax=Candidatus Allofournierella excrementavium TaxID=2838591 RepID=UPI003A8AC7FF